MAKDKISDLTDKQKLFCHEYLKDLNGTQAAIRAGYSAKTAANIANENLIKPHIQSCIQELKNKRVERTDINADMVLKELAKIGFSDISEYLNDDYSLKPLEELKDKSQCIASVQIDETQGDSWKSKTVKFKLHDKLSALEKIAKHIGFFEKDNSQSKPVVAITGMKIT